MFSPSYWIYLLFFVFSFFLLNLLITNPTHFCYTHVRDHFQFIEKFLCTLCIIKLDCEFGFNNTWDRWCCLFASTIYMQDYSWATKFLITDSTQAKPLIATIDCYSCPDTRVSLFLLVYVAVTFRNCYYAFRQPHSTTTCSILYDRSIDALMIVTYSYRFCLNYYSHLWNKGLIVEKCLLFSMNLFFLMHIINTRYRLTSSCIQFTRVFVSFRFIARNVSLKLYHSV